MADEQNRLNLLKQQTEELEKQQSIKKTLLENDARFGKPTLEAIEKLTSQIKENEAEITRLVNARNLSNDLSLEKEIDKLKNSALNALNDQIGLTATLDVLQDNLVNGSEEEVKNATRFAQILNGISDGTQDLESILNIIVNEDLGQFNKGLDDIATVLENAKNEGEDLSQKIKIKQDSIDSAEAFANKVKEFTDLLSSPTALGTATLAVVGSLLKDLADTALEVRQEFGTSAGESLKIAGNLKIAGIQAKLLGGSATEAEAAAKGLVQEFGSLDVLTASTASGVASLTARFGIGGANAAKLLKQLSAINGESIETNINTLETVGNLAEANRVAPALVLNDLAESTETFAKFASDGGDELARAAIEARKLGLNLGTVDKIAESLLDFESSIEAQLEAQVLLGRSLNLDRARQLALSGDLEGVLAEVKNQVGGAAEFAKLDVIQRKALAAAVGLEVSELSKLAAGEDTVKQATEERNKLLMRNMAIGAAAGAALIATAMALKAIVTGGTSIIKDAFSASKGAAAGIAVDGFIGGAAGALATAAPELETGGEVTETGMAKVHKGEVFSGTKNEMGFGGADMTETNGLLSKIAENNVDFTETNKILKQNNTEMKLLREQNEFLMNKFIRGQESLSLSNT
tara:strand:- start:766 stop:2673 length:1908 start_codon:yes stop_codon:yes gene_type:complete